MRNVYIAHASVRMTNNLIQRKKPFFICLHVHGPARDHARDHAHVREQLKHISK
jgi:hypothetical protein